VLVLAAGTSTQSLLLFYGGAPQRYQWVHFALGEGYEVMSACVLALAVYIVALSYRWAGRVTGFACVTAMAAFGYIDYLYFQLFLSHLPFSTLEYLGELSNFTSSARAVVLDMRFGALVLLPVALAGWGFFFAIRDSESGWSAKRHGLVLGALFLVGLLANTASNSYVGKNIEDVLEYTPLQHFLATRRQVNMAPVVLTADVLSRLAPSSPAYPLVHDDVFSGCRRPSAAFRELCARLHPLHAAALQPNIVFVMIESFRAQEIGALGGQVAEGLSQGKSLTPNFDALTAHGILFRNFFGTGFQTRHGLVSSYCSLYPPMGKQILGGYDRVRERCLPELLAARGYHTLWVHGGDADFDGQRSFLLHNGFQRIIDRWDFPVGAPTVGWGIADIALMDRAVDEMRSLPQPFFVGVLTISNHHPFEVPSGFAHHDGSEYGRFLDTMAYTDQALGRLMERARTEPFFRNTLFFFYADHSVPQPAAQPINSVAADLVWRHRIPLLVTGEGLQPQIVDDPGSQVDLPPLVMDLLGGEARTPWEGRSPVQVMPAKRTLVYYPGHYVAVMANQGAARLSQGKWEQSGTVDPADRQWAEDLTLATQWALENDHVTPAALTLK
jgi:arylsulfatase A-like enzyme